MKQWLFHIHQRLFARQRFYRINRVVLKLGFQGIGVVNYQNPIVSGERYMLQKLLPSWFAHRNAKVVDVGANIGAFSESLLESLPDAMVYAIEPQRSTAR